MTIYKTPRSPASFAALIFASAFVLVCGTVQGQAPDPLKEGDAHDAKLETKEALRCYLEVEKAQPTNADVLAKIAREYRHLMSDADGDAAKLKLGAVALNYGKRAAA